MSDTEEEYEQPEQSSFSCLRKTILKQSTCLIICLIINVVIIVLIIYFGFYFSNQHIEDKIWETKILSEENDMTWKAFLKMPSPSNFKIYFFTIVNPIEVKRGEKPIVKEIGPYVYNLYTWKDKIKFSDNKNEVSYYEYFKFIFNQDASGDLNDSDHVVAINSLYLNFIYSVDKDPSTSSLLGIINLASDAIFGQHNGIILNVTVKEYLFDGVRFCKNQSAGSIIAAIICAKLKDDIKKYPQIKQKGNDFTYAMLEWKNNTPQGYYTVKTGKQDRMETGILISMDNQTFGHAWINDKYKCNAIGGGITGTFPCNVKKTSKFKVFARDFCRSLELEFSRTETVNGIEGYVYVVPERTFECPSHKKENECYCTKGSHNLYGDLTCLYDGILDLTTCQGGSIMLSFPHLLYGDSRYIKSVEGLNPQKEQHETSVTVEPMTGTPLRSTRRIQFNIFLRPIEKVNNLKNVNHALVPMFWIDDIFTLPEEYQHQIKHDLYGSLKTFDILKYTALVIAVLLLVVCTGLYVYAHYF